jgi:type II secretory pathway pseudopilin PulG
VPRATAPPSSICSHAARLLNCSAYTSRVEPAFTYLGLMILVAILALATSATLTLGSIAQRREAEQRLLEVGDRLSPGNHQLREQQPGGSTAATPLRSPICSRIPRYPGVRRHLRRLYPDPISGSNEWGLVAAPGGGIMGDSQPVERAGDQDCRVRSGKRGFRGGDALYAMGVCRPPGGPRQRRDSATGRPAADPRPGLDAAIAGAGSGRDVRPAGRNGRTVKLDRRSVRAPIIGLPLHSCGMGSIRRGTS